MKVKAISSCFVLATLHLASCTGGLDEDPLTQDDPGALGEDGDVSSVQQPLPKGTVGAVNGQNDYCASAANPCVSGEGDCDSNAQCTGGAVCVADNGANFGFRPDVDVCAPAHCDNGILDAGLGETSADCGGPCGTCAANCTGTPGGNSFCTSCLCASGQGDCDANAECQTGLICGTNNGPGFGLRADFDVCVPAQCENGQQDNGETGVDSGGPCGSGGGGAGCSGTPGGASFCVGCQCTSGQGDCDGNAQCATGLVCATDNGPQFDLPATYDVCVPPHCTNGMLDAGQGETGIDAGGPCGTTGAPPPPPVANLYFSEYVEGTGGNRALEIFNGGTLESGCSIRLYLQGSPTPSTIISLPDLSPGVFTLCHSSSTIGRPPCNTFTSFAFNGDDAIELICGATVHDVIGQIGVDPGLEWGSGLTSTADNTLRRKCTVNDGDSTGTNPFDPAVEWDGFAIDTFSGLGSRGCL